MAYARPKRGETIPLSRERLDWLSAELVASSRRSVSWGTARKTAYEKWREKRGATRRENEFVFGTKPLSLLFSLSVFSSFALDKLNA